MGVAARNETPACRGRERTGGGSERRPRRDRPGHRPGVRRRRRPAGAGRPGRGASWSAAEQCAELGAEVVAHPTQVGDAAAVEALARAAIDRLGRIDVWVKDAGTSLWGPFEVIPVQAHRRLIEVDLLGVVNGRAAAVPRMLAQGGPAVIVNVASIGGRLPSPWATTYAAPSTASPGSPTPCGPSSPCGRTSPCAASVPPSSTLPRTSPRATGPAVRCARFPRW
ncbi:SDR family NAD(P)-dependent oxidoreductase [Blastococcus atacamensis]|uniref:SDR family NAD(P)-dependent oxidoreductase n=1 Tax=Blastococcus atacamensis TaxID=2070508 RepID=UPI000CEC42A8